MNTRGTTLPEQAASKSPSSTQEGHGGVTLLDLVLAISGAWAIPYAVEASMGHESMWRLPAYLVGAVGAFFWAWYCKVFGWVIHRRLLADKPAGTTPTMTVLVTVYFGVLAVSLVLQYSLYRAILFLLAVVQHRV
jgi:hypothetical protein